MREKDMIRDGALRASPGSIRGSSTMAMPALKAPFADRLPDVNEMESARQAHDLLAPFTEFKAPMSLTIKTPAETATLDLQPAVAQVLVELLRHIKAGRAVTLIGTGAVLTTQQAADMLNVSRPFLIGLIDKGELSASKVGRHRRLEAQDVLAYKRRRDAERDAALDALLADSGDLE
jgi:excisionase family DNA binding protein